MTPRLRSTLAGARGWLGSLSLPALAAVGVLIASGVGTGGYYAYQTYDYVQHDNNFCLSCHLMVEPYERFAQSEHRGLGCKACHQPSMVERSTMALTQIIENPEELGIHAEVPNARCAGCHVEGDPEKWALIANSAGHRVHLESDDPGLRGLRCVECHSTSVHEFTAVDRTCAQSGCHEDSQIELGGMSDLTIHCAACHAFSTPLGEEVDAAAIDAALAPDRDTCLSCHVMRTLVGMPEPDPHEGVCASCHDPHTQETPQQAAESCALGGCHTAADTLTTFHVGLAQGVLEDCAYCHQAHDFSVDGSNCLACHQGVLEDDLDVPRPAPLADDTLTLARSVNLAPVRAAMSLHTGGVGVGWWAPVVQVAPTFLHSEHRELECATCHETDDRHSTLSVTTLQDCRSCHHTEPMLDDCATCHTESESPADPYQMVRTLSMSVGEPVRRPLPFDHDDHETEECASCHTDGLDLSAGAVDCTSCHEEHHEVETACVSCHVQAPNDDHPIDQSHLTCSGSGCHQDVPFEGVPKTPEVCLVCHQDMQDHRPERNDCAECHALSGIGARDRR